MTCRGNTQKKTKKERFWLIFNTRSFLIKYTNLFFFFMPNWFNCKPIDSFSPKFIFFVWFFWGRPVSTWTREPLYDTHHSLTHHRFRRSYFVDNCFSREKEAFFHVYLAQKYRSNGTNIITSIMLVDVMAELLQALLITYTIQPCINKRYNFIT